MLQFFLNESYIYIHLKGLKNDLIKSSDVYTLQKSISIIGYLLYKIIQNIFLLRFKQDQPYNFYKPLFYWI